MPTAPSQTRPPHKLRDMGDALASALAPFRAAGAVAEFTTPDGELVVMVYPRERHFSAALEGRARRFATLIRHPRQSYLAIDRDPETRLKGLTLGRGGHWRAYLEDILLNWSNGHGGAAWLAPIARAARLPEQWDEGGLDAGSRRDFESRMGAHIRDATNAQVYRYAVATMDHGGRG